MTEHVTEYRCVKECYCLDRVWAAGDTLQSATDPGKHFVEVLVKPKSPTGASFDATGEDLQRVDNAVIDEAKVAAEFPDTLAAFNKQQVAQEQEAMKGLIAEEDAEADQLKRMFR